MGVLKYVLHILRDDHPIVFAKTLYPVSIVVFLIH